MSIAPQEPPESVRMAHVIRDDAEAIDIAHAVAAELAVEAASRDRERRLPYREIDVFSRSGLWGITVPKSYGGAGVSNATLAEVTAIIAAADSSLGQIPQNHFYMVEALRLDGDAAQRRFYFSEVLKGARFGNAFSEFGTRTVLDFKTRLTRRDGRYVLNGKKFYSSGALFAHWVPVVAKDDADRVVIVFVRQGTPGVEIIDDWSSFGQRTTASGTATFTDVEVSPFAVVPHHAAFDRPTPMGAVAQIVHAAVDLGIARAAIAETIRFVREESRPWIDSGQEHAAQDPYTIAAIGRLQIDLHAAEALIARAGRHIDAAFAEPATSAAASIAVAEAKVATTEIAIEAANKLFELGGTRATLARHALDRHWRNARTHTLHDPVRWKYHAVGNYWLNDIDPPRHGAL